MSGYGRAHVHGDAAVWRCERAAAHGVLTWPSDGSNISLSWSGAATCEAAGVYKVRRAAKHNSLRAAARCGCVADGAAMLVEDSARKL